MSTTCTPADQITVLEPDAELAQAFARSAHRCIEQGLLDADDRLIASPVAVASALAQEGGRAAAALVDLILALPERLFGGDVDALARACGFDATSREVLTRLHTPGAMRLSRGDAFLTAQGWQFVEFNIGSAIGGFQFSRALRAIEGSPAMASALRDVGFVRHDTARSWARMTLDLAREQAPQRAGEAPVVCIVDSPAHFARYRRWNASMARDLEEAGARAAVACTIDDIELRAGGIFHAGQRVDFVYRLFGLSDILSAPARYERLIACARAGQVGFGMSLSSRVFSNKAVLALLADPAHAQPFDAAERELVARHVPRTRLLDERALAEGVGERAHWVLKPIDGQSADGVVFGEDESDDAWHARLRGLTGARPTHVLQRRIETSQASLVGWSAPGQFERNRFNVVYGLYAMSSQPAGIVVRATPQSQKLVHYSAASYAALAYEAREACAARRAVE